MNIERLRRLRQELITPTNPEWAQIVILRSRVSQDLATRGSLNIQTFDAILDWKLRAQRGRTEGRRTGNTESLIRELTGAFWRIRHEDAEMEIEIKLTILMAIPGVAMGVASAILTLSDPAKYGIVDYRVWKVLYAEDKRQFSIADYRKYTRDVRSLASRLGCDVQEVDYVLWKEFERTDQR